jgi:glycogen(starch) synthase
VDLVHALGASGLGYALARRRDLPAPFVFNPQGLEEFGGTHPGFARIKRLAYTPLQAAVRTCARAADAVLATDHALVAPVRTHLGIEPARIHVVPNAVDLETIDRARTTAAGPAATLRARLGLAAGERLLVSVGRLEENKGFHVLADALAQLQARAGHWRWVLVGDGPYRSTIAAGIEAAGLARRVQLAGRVSETELAAWYAAADIFVHPTLYEGSSLVTLEAMANGKPVVATRAGGLPDKVRPGETGWLVEPGSPSALAEALADGLAQGDETLARFGRAGRALVEQAFAWPVVAAALVSLYEALVHDAGPAGRTPTREAARP